MKKNIKSTALFLGFSTFAFGQVGINTNTPEATFDIRGKNDTGTNGVAVPGAVTAKDGMLVPRVSNLAASGSVNGQLVYLVANTTTPAFTKGFYYWDGTVWTGFSSAGGDTTDDAWINDTTNTMVKLGTTSTGAARPATASMVVKDNGNVGIGTASPGAKLEIASGTAGASGLKFTNLNSSSTPVSTDKSLSVDGSGNVILATPVVKGSDLGLFASDTSTVRNLTSTYNTSYITTTFNGENADTDNRFNPTTGIYTVPSAGYYYFQGVSTFDNTQNGGGFFSDVGLRIYKGGSSVAQQFNAGNGTTKLLSVSISTLIQCAAGDQITLRHTVSPDGFQYRITGPSFVGWKVSNL